MEGLRISYVTLFVRDLDACRRFYGEGLGLAVAHDSPSFVQFATGGSTLALHAVQDPARLSHGVNLHFDVADVGAAAAEVRRRGVVMEGEPRDEPWGARVMRVQDPAGNTVELIQWLR